MTKINEHMGVLMGEKKGYAAAFDQLMSERRNVAGYTKGLFDQCDELTEEIPAKIAERQELSFESFEVVSAADGWQRKLSMCQCFRVWKRVSKWIGSAAWADF